MLLSLDTNLDNGFRSMDKRNKFSRKRKEGHHDVTYINDKNKVRPHPNVIESSTYQIIFAAFQQETRTVIASSLHDNEMLMTECLMI